MIQHFPNLSADEQLFIEENLEFLSSRKFKAHNYGTGKVFWSFTCRDKSTKTITQAQFSFLLLLVNNKLKASMQEQLQRLR
jgi:hypothetical protein